MENIFDTRASSAGALHRSQSASEDKSTNERNRCAGYMVSTDCTVSTVYSVGGSPRSDPPTITLLPTVTTSSDPIASGSMLPPNLNVLYSTESSPRHRSVRSPDKSYAAALNTSQRSKSRINKHQDSLVSINHLGPVGIGKPAGEGEHGMLHGRTGYHDYECHCQAVTPGGRVAAASSPVSLITGNDHLTVLHSGGQIMEPRADTPLRYGIQTTERSMPHGVSTSNHSQHGHGHDGHGHLHGNGFEAMGHMGIAENQYAAAAFVLEDGEIQEYIPLDDEDGLNENDFDENADLLVS